MWVLRASPDLLVGAPEDPEPSGVRGAGQGTQAQLLMNLGCISPAALPGPTALLPPVRLPPSGAERTQGTGGTHPAHASPTLSPGTSRGACGLGRERLPFCPPTLRISCLLRQLLGSRQLCEGGVRGGWGRAAGLVSRLGRGGEGRAASPAPGLGSERALSLRSGWGTITGGWRGGGTQEGCRGVGGGRKGV